ncbi:SDR family NAD(P)-dependent oxidoreductase [Archangium lansingense]|uniref:3-oxoacyl-ACP reductase FabG n=1 Tax=Archangium lansingense TaxID=2995310 RepID=A0ABT4ALE8_9BACT|nr:3-oxoacyl-ACP reductase FabG [Archangium lansinium]MCY1082528.1 3-oxoacyl-ACP reductase FabG [Archangium lansinium]
MTPGKNLEGKVALVTGAGRGIGRTIALRLAREGAAVAVHYRASEEGARAVAEEIHSAGGRALLLQADLRDPAHCKRVVTDTEGELKRLDILVHNAGVARGGPIMGADFEGIRETLETNLHAALHLTAAAVPGMSRRRHGRVVAIGSPVGTHGGLQGQCAYAASKAGLAGFIKTLANELSPRMDFTANLVSPGVVPTDMSAFGIESFGEQLRAAIPLGRFGTLEDVAEAVAFLVSPHAAYINGQELGVDGGYSLKYVNRRRAQD